ncbi:uncharacterized protein [Macaca nemestrina]|uniref:uncharacterized protein isoform X5 n=1 Tax=Macaca nemestrina TaxID=9545 RepID=UPI0039B8EDF1
MPLHSHSARNASSSLVFSFQDLNSNPIGSPDTAGGRVSLSPKDIHGWMRGADISPSVTTFSLALEEVLPPLAVTSDPRPFNQQLPEPPDPRCVLEPQDNPEVAPAPVCALCCCFGIIYCCFGYRCFKTVMFLSGLLSGASYCATSVISRVFKSANWDQDPRPQPPTPSWTWILTVVPLYPLPESLVLTRPEPGLPLLSSPL